MPRLGPVTLEGRFVRLEPLAERHFEDLAAAASDPDIWRWLPTRSDGRQAFEAWFTAAIDLPEDRELPFAVVERMSGRAVGSTRYIDIDEANRGVEVGWTWYQPAAQGTAVNPEAKLLLLAHAFEDWGAIRVFFKTDSLNVRSRAAIEKLGAVYEGDLRNHRIRPDGTFRHSSHYSVLPGEWPAVRAGLERRLGRPAPATPRAPRPPLRGPSASA
jgi:RimJ/RimL family protein N-acetyltransferase